MLITPIKVAVNRDRPSEALNNVSLKAGGYGAKVHGASFPGGHASSRRICQLHACAIAGFIIGYNMEEWVSAWLRAQRSEGEREFRIFDLRSILQYGNAMVLNRSKQAHAESQPEGGWRGQSKLHLQGAIEEWTAICISDWMGAQ